MRSAQGRKFGSGGNADALVRARLQLALNRV